MMLATEIEGVGNVVVGCRSQSSIGVRRELQLQKFGHAKENVESATVVTEMGKAWEMAWQASAL